MRENPGTDVSGGENGGVSMGFGGLYASVGDHIGHFYQTGEERTSIVVAVMDAMKTHPLCVVSNVIHQNPYYEKPEVFLDELRLRHSTVLAS